MCRLRSFVLPRVCDSAGAADVLRWLLQSGDGAGTQAQEGLVFNIDCFSGSVWGDGVVVYSLFPRQDFVTAAVLFSRGHRVEATGSLI
jgi:hypothetical protein